MKLKVLLVIFNHICHLAITLVPHHVVNEVQLTTGSEGRGLMQNGCRGRGWREEVWREGWREEDVWREEDAWIEGGKRMEA